MKTVRMSLNILYSILEKHLPVEAFIENDECCISGVRVYCAGVTLDRSYVYVRGDEKNASCSEVLHVNGRIKVEAPWNQTINMIMSLMEQFREFDSLLRIAAMSDDPFQKMAEIAYSMLDHPVMITSNIFRVIGIAGNDSGVPWEYSKTHRFSPPGFVSYYTHASRYLTYMTGHTPLFEKLPSFCNWKAFLRINCFYENEARCRLVISVSDEEAPSKGFTDIAEYIGSIIELIPQEISAKYFYGEAASAPFIEKNGQPLLCNNPLYSKISHTIGTKEFYVCQIAPIEYRENHIELYWIYSRLETLNIDAVSYLYDDKIVFLIPSSDRVRCLLYQSLFSMLDELNFICLISNPCNDLNKIHKCINQTNRLFAECRDLPTRFVYYEDYAEQCMISEIVSNLDLDVWVYEGLRKLIDYDAQKKTDYYKTLCCLAKNQFVHNVTSAELFLHRNSLQYRIEKIEQILNCNLSDANVRFFVRLSILLTQPDIDRDDGAGF